MPFNYYHSCLKNLAEALAPLTQFLSKRFKGIRKVPWDKESEMAFENVKKLVCQATLLAYPVAGSKLILQTDASDLSTGAALLQVSEGKLQPLTFHSRKLTDVQKRQTILDRELLLFLMLFVNLVIILNNRNAKNNVTIRH